MKRWKQVSIYCLAAVLTAAGPVGSAWAGSPSFSRSAQEWAALQDNVMEYGELTGLIHEYNVTVQNNQRDFNDKKNKDSDEIAQIYRDQAEAVRGSLSGGDSAMEIAQDAMAEASARNLEQQADDNVSDSEIIKLTYDQTEAALVSTAQSNMISYYQKVKDLEMKQKNKELLSATYDSVVVKARADVGMATQLDVLTALENVQKAEGAILTAQSELQNTKQKLCVMLGWKYDAAPEIREIPAVDLSRLDRMNPETDKAAALEQNYTLKTNKKKLANAINHSTKETLQLTIDDNVQKISTTISSSYKSVLQAKLAYDQTASEVALEAKNMEAADRKMAIGSISRLDYMTQQYTYLQKQANQEEADRNLFQAMETYDWAVKGLASAS